MHRFEGAQHLVRDGRSSYFPPNNQYPGQGTPFNREGAMFHPPQPPNRVYPPGSNPRLTSLLSSVPSASSPANFEESGNSGGYPYRMGVQHHHGSHLQNFHNKGAGMLESMGEEYAHKVRSGHLPPPPYGSHGQMQGSFGNMGYGNVGGANTGGSRYNPYHQPHSHQQQPRSGFLEQLLKNQRVQHSTSYSPYGRQSSSGMMMGQTPSSSQASIAGHQQFYPQGYRGMGNVGYGPGMMSGGGGGAGTRMGNYFGHQPGNMHHQQYNWRMGGPHGYQYHHGPQQGGSGFHPHHYQQHPYYQQHPRNPPYLPIRNESNEGGQNAEDENDQEIGKSEMRYRKNHERMNAILDETLANCNPIKVPMERVDSLRNHVRLLTDDLNKHRKDAIVVKEVCSKRLQNFKDSTARFHADYKKLCQPIAEEEYNDLVDKYYKELKDKLNQERENEGVVPPTGGNAANSEVVMEGIGDILLASERNEQGAKEEKESSSLSPSNCSPAKKPVPQELATGRNLEEDVIPPQEEDYFDHPLFIDIPPEENDSLRATLPAQPQGSSQQQQQNQLYQQNQIPPGLFPSPPIIHEAGGGNDLYFGNHQLQPPQQEHMEYSYFPPGSIAFSGGSGMTNLLMPAQGQHPPPPPLQQAPFLRGHHAYQNQQYPSSSYYQHQQQHQSSTRGQHYHPHQLVPPPLVSPQVKRHRPSEELREFLLGLVRGKYREESTPPQMVQQVPQLQQQQGPGPIPSTSTAQPQESMQPRRFMMSGGGIVEMKQSPPPQQPPPQQEEEQPAMYEDAATREWINSLTTDAPQVESNIVPSAEEGEDETSQDDNNNLQMDLNSEFMDNSPSGNSATGKTSKIAEILESPCLNDNIVEEFESDLRQLEVALHGHPVDDLPLPHEEIVEHEHQEPIDIHEDEGTEENVQDQ